MNTQTIEQILTDAAHPRTAGSDEERRCAEYLAAACARLGLIARIEEFPLPIHEIREAHLQIDGEDILCRGYAGSSNGTVEAKVVYLPNTDEVALRQCRDRIVLVDGGMNIQLYRAIIANGALGFITYSGGIHYRDRDIAHWELRGLTDEDKRIPGVTIHAEDAIRIAGQERCRAFITLAQETRVGTSRNVLLDLPGEVEQTVILSAHYDSVPLSDGAYDNLSGCIALLAIAQHFARIPHRLGIRLVWCGAEERGLLGSLAYCDAHVDEISRCVLNVNLDMLGSTMGKFVAFATDEQTQDYLAAFAAAQGIGLETKCGIRSSDSNSFADRGVPSVSFARYAPGNTAPIHTRYDTAAVVSPRRLAQDTAIITAFTERVMDDAAFPLGHAVCDKVKEDLDKYFHRKH